MNSFINPLKPLLFPLVIVLLFATLAINISIFAQFDNGILQAFSHLPRSLTPFAETISHLGDYYTNIAMIVILAGIELCRRQYIRAFVSGLALATFPLYFLIKEAIARARPAGDFIIAYGLPGYSFPSGHAVTSAVAFGLLSIMAYSALKKPWKYIIPGLSLLTVVLIGMSRVYLGAHFPTDVIAGWLLALISLSLLRSLSLLLAKKTGRKLDTTEDAQSAKA